MKKVLYVYCHVLKTGGTTITLHIEKNYREEEKLRISRHVNEKMVNKDYVISYLEKLTVEEKNKLKIIYGTDVCKSIENVFPTREIRFIVFLREPYERTKSHYLHDNNDKKETFLKFMTRNEQRNYQQQYLVSRGFLTLSDFYFIGVQKIRNDYLFLYHLLGFKRFYLNQMVTKKELYLNTRLKKQYWNLNKIDVGYYGWAFRKNFYFKIREPNYERMVRRVKWRRRFWLLFYKPIFWFYRKVLKK